MLLESLKSKRGKSFEYLPPTPPFGYVVSPYPHPNGALGAMSMVNKVPMVPPSSHPASPLSFMMYNTDAFQPPPAHMGIPPVHIDPKTGESSSSQVLLSKHFCLGIPRAPVYPLTTHGQYHHPIFSPDFTQQFQWHPSNMYSMASGSRYSPFPGTIPLSTSNLTKFAPPTLIPPHPGIPTHPGLSHLIAAPKPPVASSPESSFLCNFSFRDVPNLNSSHSSPSRKVNESHSTTNTSESSSHHNDKKKNHIKKPLNAFMLYMKEMRSKVVAECTLKESAAINQILGRKWHSLSREEQSKYYEMARKERQLHMQLYPGWSARDNYALNAKKKKRKRDKSLDGDGNNPKKCRARFGLDQQSSWCKPCRRKKKCIRYVSGSDNTGESEDNIGSVGSVGSLEAPTPDSRCGDGDLNSDSEDSDIDGPSVSSELSLSSPPVPSVAVDSSRTTENDGLPLGSPPYYHPLSVQHLSQPACSARDSPDPDQGPVPLPQLPTPPSTDSSTAAAPSLLTVT